MLVGCNFAALPQILMIKHHKTFFRFAPHFLPRMLQLSGLDPQNFNYQTPTILKKSVPRPPIQPNCRVERCVALAIGWATWHRRVGVRGCVAPVVKFEIKFKLKN